MFRPLTKDEAVQLVGMLTGCYKASRTASHALNVNKRAVPHTAYAYLCDKMLNSQAAMRQELTQLRWQIKREKLT